MVLVISSNQVINGFFPQVNEAITKFIDALVSLKVDPEAEFSKKMNDFVSDLGSDYVESQVMFNNRNLLKNLSLLSLSRLANFIFTGDTYEPTDIKSFSLILGNENQTDKVFVASSNNIKDELQEGYSTNPTDLVNTNESTSREPLTYDDLFNANLTEDVLRESAESLDSDFNKIIQADQFYSQLEYFPVKQFNSIANNKNIIPAFKILNLRPLVSDLNGFMRLAEDGNDVVKQVATALDKELIAKATSEQLDNYKKLALAVFPSEIAGRLRAAGFAPTSSKA